MGFRVRMNSYTAQYTAQLSDWLAQAAEALAPERRERCKDDSFFWSVVVFLLVVFVVCLLCFFYYYNKLTQENAKLRGKYIMAEKRANEKHFALNLEKAARLREEQLQKFAALKSHSDHATQTETFEEEASPSLE